MLFAAIDPAQYLKSSNLVKNSDSEIQQRANEYLALSFVANPNVLVR